jgi:hypothetical protein
VLATIPAAVTAATATRPIMSARRAGGPAIGQISSSEQITRARAPDARVYTAPPIAAATAGPTASSGTRPQSGPTIARATAIPTVSANGNASSIAGVIRYRMTLSPIWAAARRRSPA